MNTPPTIIMPFGKHAGQPLAEVPDSYLLWCLRSCKLSGGLRLAIGNELRRRNVDVPAPLPVRIPACDRCGSTPARTINHGLSQPRQLADFYFFRWQENAAGQRVIRAECRHCSRFLIFVPTIEPFESLADENASSTPILDVLTKLDDLGIEVKSDGRRAWLGWEDEKRVPPAILALIRECNNQLARIIGPRRN
jgi:hypothetical protein